MRHRFFLGGRDLEMAEIRKLLDRHARDRIEDRHLPWGAKLSQYRDELLAASDVYDCLSRGRAVRMALGQVMSAENAALSPGCEVAFFPPVTGG